MLTAKFSFNRDALERADLTLALTMPVEEWRSFVREMDANRRASTVDHLAGITRRALKEYDVLTGVSLDIGEYFTNLSEDG